MGSQISATDASANMGSGGQYMPPYVRSVAPGPGITAAPNVPILVEFNDPMLTASINSTNLQLWQVGGTQITSGVSVSLDSTKLRFATISHGTLLAGTYEVRVLGGASNSTYMPMRMPTSSVAFSSQFTVSGSNDTTGPTIYPSVANNSTGVATNKVFDFGLSEQLTYSTVSNSNITMLRGTTAVSINVSYNPGNNSVTLAPGSALAPNTVYTVTFSPSVTDLAGNAVATTTYTYTTGASDTTAPQLREARCDDYRCEMTFNEPMVSDSQSDSRFAASILNPNLWTITSGGSVVSLTGKPFSYDSTRNAVSVTGLTLTIGATVTTSISASSTDLSDNLVSSTLRSFTGKVENSKSTFGSFGDMGMFTPPTESFMGSGGIGAGEFKPMGFGSFTADQFAMGQADMAFAFNPTASADSNVFQVRFAPGVVLATGDQVVLTFPNGTTVTNAALDTYSPFYSDFNQSLAGVITGSGVVADNTVPKVTVTLAVSATPNASDPITIDLKKILNPSIPKDPSSGGYTVSIKVLRGGVAVATKTSMPYFIMAGGTNTLTVDVVAGANTSTPDNGSNPGGRTANGAVYLHGGGPGGPMDKALTLTNGDISAVDGSAATSISYANLPNGCYFIGTDPYVTLNGSDYYGQMSPEPVCLTGGETKTKWLLLTSASGGSTATVTVKFVGSNGLAYDFGGKDIDIMAGGPGKFVVKNLIGVTTSLSAGYQIKLNANGHWFVGMGPAMPKSASGGRSVDLGVMPPPPVDLNVTNIATTPVITLGTPASPGVSYSNGTVTFTFAAADKTVTGTVKDVAGNGLANVEVFLHRQGFGAPVFTGTNASGTFSLSVPSLGNYEIGVHKDGLPDVTKNIELRSGNTVFVNGQNVTGNFVIIMKKAAYTISGKVLDGSNNAIGYAPVMAVDNSGNNAFGMTSSDGSYTLFVDNGTWTLRAQLPPSKTDTCGSLTKSVTVSSANQSSQNITPSTNTCYTLSGTIANSTNTPVFIQEWDNTNSRPVNGGARISASTDSTGAYSVKVAAGTYRVGSRTPTYGEVSTVATVTATTTANITMSNVGTVNFGFIGGNANMTALIELKNNADKNKRASTAVNGLSSTTSISVPDSTATYTYFADVFGVGKFSGTITSFSSGVANVVISLSGTDFITVTGTVFDSASSTRAGALVTFSNASTTVTAVADSSGEYSLQVKAGAYTISAALSGYLGSKATSTFTTNTADYDFGGSGADKPAMSTSTYTIRGTVSSSAGAALTDGYVWAINATGTVVTAPVNADGTYSLAVDNGGTWTIKGTSANHAETTNSTTVTVAGADQTGVNFALTADTTNAATSTSGIVTAATGGSVDDTNVTGIKLTAGEGVLETGSGDVTLNFEKSYNAPDTATVQALGNASFNISATGDSTIKTTSGNVEIVLDYSSLLADIPTSTSESSLQLSYYSPERGEYVPVEGGFTVDTVNNTITGLVSHFTDFVITYTQGSAGVTVTESSGSTAVTEGGATDSVSYVLTSQPTANVVITPSIASQATPSPSSLTFTTVNYATAQSITITATDDSTVEGTHSATITHAVTSGDSNYNGLSISNITVTITDNDTAGGGGGGGSTADTTPPTNTSVVIAGGATSTAITSVNLTLAATDASQMMIGNDSAFTSSTWVTYSTTKAWVLTSGAGTKTVYAKFRDSAGNISTAVSDTITLTVAGATTTSTPPVVVTPPAAVTLPTVATTLPTVASPVAVANRFKNNLVLGARGNAVKDLQSYLKELGHFTYPTITGNYGPVTMKAVQAYQKANGLMPNGKLDAATRESLNGGVTASQVPTAPAVTSGYKFTSALRIGSSGEEVRQLQQLLKDLGYFTMPNITGYYGAGTKAAVVKFQKAKGLKPYPGHLGPATRAALNEM